MTAASSPLYARGGSRNRSTKGTTMSRTTKPASPAAQAGAIDGELAYYAFQRAGTCRDYTDDFIRRTDLAESDRAAYKTAWYAAHSKAKAAY